ncbi:MAG: hypothetical protein ACFCVH_00255 [Alphaproteobacteria bacterium]
MKLIGHETGRLIVLFPAEEIRPHSGMYLPYVQAELNQRYGFIKQPDLSRPIEELDRDGYKFGHGRAVIDGRLIAIIEFAIYNDGIVINCNRTDDAELIWSDLMEWSKDALGIREFTREPRKLYRSVLIVEFENQMSSLLKDFADIKYIVEDALTNTPHRGDVDFVSISFGLDPTKIPGLSPPPFVIERRGGSPYEQNRYFCQAPLPTQAHINALERLEIALSSR